MLNYLTVLVYTKTILLFTSVSVASGGYFHCRFVASVNIQH